MQYIEQYAALLSRWTGAYVCAVYSYVGLNTSQGPRLLYGKIVFDPFSVEVSGVSPEFKTEHFFAGRFAKRLAREDVAAAIEGAKEGHIEGLVDLSPAENSSTQFSPYSESDYHPLVSKLFIRGATRHHIEQNLPRYIDWEMKTADTPFDTLNELLADYGLPPWAPGSNATELALVAKAPAEITRQSTIKDGKCLIECRAAKALDIRKLKIGCRMFREKGIIIRSSGRGDTFDWTDVANHKLGKCYVNAGDAPVLEAYLSYDGIPLDQSSIVDPQKHLNALHAIHQLFDPAVENLRKMLSSPDKEKGRDFEAPVSVLLTLLGFRVSHYGRFPKFEQGADIIAMTPDGNVAVVECTTGLPSQKNHIGKLVTRAHSIREKLDASGYTAYAVRPVIVTSLSRIEIQGDLEALQKHNISVISKENLEDALNQIALPPDAERFFSDFGKLIPSLRPRL